MLAGQWSEALAANNIITIFHWLKKLNIKGDSCLEEHLQTFGCWLQRTSEFTKKELLSLCFSRCQGLWMFLDRSSFIKVHMLLQRLLNLLILVQWSRKQLGVGAPCMICRDTQHSSDARQSCWNQELWTLKQHIWLGRLVQWWGIMGLLPRSPEAQELRRISQMWREMELSHQEMCLKTAGWNKREMERCGFLIEGMVMQLCKRHGCIWTSEDCTDQCYPPPTLEALLKLVLVPSIDIMSVQGLHGALVESQSHCPSVLLAASMYYDLSTEKEAASHGTEISPVGKTSHRDHRGCKALCRSASSKQSKEHCSRAEATILQLKNKDCFGEMAPCPLSATLYQNQIERTMCSEELVKLVKKAVTEVRKPHPNISEVVWPKQPKRKSNSREIFLSVQALRRLTPSPFSMEALEETEQTKDYQGEHYALNPNQPETQEEILSSENQSSSSPFSFSSASSGPLLKHSHVFESTITLQRISAFLTDQESQSKGVDEEKESYFTSVDGFLPHRSELKLSPDGATEQNSLSDLDQSLKSQDKVISYALQGEEDKKYTPGEKVSDAATKMVSSVFHKKDDQSDVFLAMSGDQEGRELLQQRETRGCGIQDYSSTPSTSPQDLVTDPNQSFVSEDIPLTGSPTINNAASPCVLDPSFAYSLANFIDFSAKHTDDKQGGGEKPAGWRGKAPQQGAMSGRTQCRKGKRVKRT
ncbi:uncharacterized protein FYW61_014643 isoform 2-T2 [Anableps anableps]